MPVGVLASWPVWRRRETVLGNIAGTVVILGTAFALIFRESTALDVAQRNCFDAGFAVCTPTPTAFARYAIYASIGMIDLVVHEVVVPPPAFEESRIGVLGPAHFPARVVAFADPPFEVETDQE